MVFELEIDGTLGGGEVDGDDMLLKRNLVDLSDVLADELVEEGLCDLVAALMPCGRPDLTERVEFLDSYF